MKMYLKSLIGVIALLFFTAVVNAQSTTFILLRHAEKDTSSYGSMMMNADPPLSKSGELRAERLVNVLAAFKPDIIYSTNYKRTKATAAPLAAQSGKEIQLYDPKKLPLFADSLLLVKGKTIVVVGHSNTTPALVDLLIKENKYAALDDAEYGTYWIVTVAERKSDCRRKKILVGYLYSSFISMLQKKSGVDIINKVLEAVYAADKDSLFIMSLMHQYEDRGFLTKKQLEGLHDKAKKIPDITPGWLATIEAMIAKLPNRDKSPIIKKQPAILEDEQTAMQLNSILSRYPQHKTVLQLQSKFQKEHELSTAERSSLQKLYKLLVK